MVVTNTDQKDVDEQMAPFWEEGEKYFEKHIEVENNEQAVQDWIEREESFLNSNKDSVEKSWHKRWVKNLENIKKQKTVNDKIKVIAEYEGYPIDDDGNIYSEYNPRGKWDWFSVGGRWNNWLVDKNGNHRNSCKVKDIDWQGIRQAEIKSASEYYDKEIEESKKDGRTPWFSKKDGTVPTKEEYVAKFDYEPAPYSLLHNGEWTDKDSDCESDEEWAEWFKRMIGTLDPESEITIVDYHI